MIYALLPDTPSGEPRKLPFYLAMEEYLARYFEGEYFFMWQVDPTVIFGRNQQMDAEVNVGFCRSHGIGVYRRKSGGGCVYADRNNIMFSHVTTCSSVASTFTGFTGTVASMLRRMGIGEAHANGRNDIMIGDRKVSGYAFYHINLVNSLLHQTESRAIVHGTMLYDADVATMEQAITPSKVKLEAKGVGSVRQHVTTIREHSSIDIESFKCFVREELCHSTLELNAGDIEAIEQLAEPYYANEWITGTGRRHATVSRHRVEGVGEFMVDLRHSADNVPRIEAIDLAGDFFLLGDMDQTLLTPLCGCELTREALLKRLGSIKLERVIPNLRPEQLTEMLLQASGSSS